MTKSRPTIVEHNLETNEIIEREMNDAEFERHLADKTITEANAAAIAEKTTAKAALLAQLGITEEQAKLLLS